MLGNVGGLRRVMGKVLRDLEKLKWYFVIWMMIDSEALGEPVSRPRCYFLLVRRDAGISSDVSEMVEFCKKCLSGASSPVQEHVRTRMLPNDSHEVQSWLKQAMSRPAREATGQKWRKTHETFRREHGVHGVLGWWIASCAQCHTAEGVRPADDGTGQGHHSRRVSEH